MSCAGLFGKGKNLFQLANPTTDASRINFGMLRIIVLAHFFNALPDVSDYVPPANSVKIFYVHLWSGQKKRHPD